MVPGGKFLFDQFVGKENRHRLEDRDRLQRGRAMGIPPHQLAMMAPGDIPRRALPPTAYPLHRGLTYPAQQAAIQCICGSLLSPLNQPHARDCPLPLYRDALRNGERRRLRPAYPRPARRLLDRGEFSGDEEDYDHDFGLAPSVYDGLDEMDDEFDDDDEDDDGTMLPSAYSERSYERHRPRQRARRHTAVGFGLYPRDPRERYAGLMGNHRHGGRGLREREREREREMDGYGNRHRYGDSYSVASGLTW
ncbi:MAG: hypothetical protein Q9186_004358 [Xanthomendoza sp. 1 TL-2023]